MAFVTINDIFEVLRCSNCSSKLTLESNKLRCINQECKNNAGFPYLSDKPVFIDFRNSVLNEHNFFVNKGITEINRRPSLNKLRYIIRRIMIGNSSVTKKNAKMFLEKLHEKDSNPLILIVGGGTKGLGTEKIYQHPSVRILSFDIYDSPYVQFINDAHSIPLCNASIDGVWIQAVLEHVLEPQTVVSEIYRVLKKGGIIYSETPFLQGVHEGAYDFTRYTESGHRYLFRSFDLIHSGAIDGPGQVMNYAIGSMAISVFKSKRMGSLFRLIFCWLRLFDHLCSKKYFSDYASCVYFLGYKSEHTLSPHDLIKFYGKNVGDEYASSKLCETFVKTGENHHKEI